MRETVVLCISTVVLLALPSAVRAEGEPRLIGTVSDPASISLATETGDPVTQLQPGAYDIEIRDNSSAHNFRLTGPGVDRETGVSTTGTEVWEDVVVQAESTYTYVCTPHSGQSDGRPART